MNDIQNFQCRKCGECCRIKGQVNLTDDDITKLANHLNISEWEFIQKYTRLNFSRTGLALEDKPDGACLFQHDNLCTVHSAKPRQCSGFPLQWRDSYLESICPAFKSITHNQHSF